MYFKRELDLQLLIHENPDILLNGIPDISPEFCSDVSKIISLGIETPLTSGFLDNLYIDANGILTFVECKRYCDGRLKREVYSQTINYVADLINVLKNYDGEDFIKQFYSIISKGSKLNLNSFQDIVDSLSEDELLDNKDKSLWAVQFKERLELNLKRKNCRIVIVSGPSERDKFSFNNIRNLMDIMNFSESKDSHYDLMLMDLRQEGEEYTSKIIWRNYANLPLIPLVAESRRHTAEGIEQAELRLEMLSDEQKAALEDLLNKLDERGYSAKKDTRGYSIYNRSTNRTTYTKIYLLEGDWIVSRNQIREINPLFAEAKSKALQFHGIESSLVTTEFRTSKVAAENLTIEIYKAYSIPTEVLFAAMEQLFADEAENASLL